jgi:hypothetical protein
MTEERFSSNSIFLPSVHFHYNIDVKASHSWESQVEMLHNRLEKFTESYFCHILRQNSHCKHNYSFTLYIKITVEMIPFGVFRYIRCGTVQLRFLQGVAEGKRL